MNILSLFDGISCGKVALDRAAIKYNKYYASEVDKYAMKISEKNHPDIIQLGDVRGVKGEYLPKIDLLMGGSPCQGFSFAGKQLNFEDPRSQLFFEFVRILKEVKPKYFLLENVIMKQEYQDIISNLLGVQPLKINSALVSAQNRVRLYWTNIPGIEQPEDKGIFLKDILEDNPVENTVKNTNRNQRHYKSVDEKSLCLTATCYKGAGNNGMTLVPQGFKNERPCEPRDFNKESLCHHAATATDIRGNESLKRVYAPTGKTPTLTAAMGMGGGNVPLFTDKETAESFKGSYIDKNERLKYRKLTPLECERLQTVPDNYTDCVSNTQRYKALGNGWTVDVISHILSYMR